MKIRENRSKRLADQRRQPLWLRIVTFFAMALIGAASTAQLCHSHDEAIPAQSSIIQSSHSAQSSTEAPDATASTSGTQPKDSDPGKSSPDRDDSGSAVRCPLCVAMHSALPVTGHLPEVALLALVAVVPTAEDRGRHFSWRFEMASRPPPIALRPLA
jgi:hypothetical protein